MELQVLKIFSIVFGLIIGVPIILGVLMHLGLAGMATFSTLWRRTAKDGGTAWRQKNHEEAEAVSDEQRCESCHGTGWVHSH